MRLPDGIGRGGFEARDPSRHRAGAVRLSANVTSSDRSADVLSTDRVRSALASARGDGQPRRGRAFVGSGVGPCPATWMLRRRCRRVANSQRRRWWVRCWPVTPRGRSQDPP